MMNSLKTFLSRMKNVNHVINKTFTESVQGHFGFIGRDHVTAKTCWTLIHEHKTYNPTVSSSNCFLSCFAKKHKCFANKMKLKCMCAFLIGPQSSSWKSPIALVSLNRNYFSLFTFHNMLNQKQTHAFKNGNQTICRWQATKLYKQ